jgi:hypothetical protein
MYHRRRRFITGLWSMDRHIGTAITDTVTANPGMAASSGPSRFRSGVRTGAYLFEDAQLKSTSTFETDDRQALSDADLPFSYNRDAIDPVLVEVLAAAHFLVTSRDVLRLEELLREEETAVSS